MARLEIRNLQSTIRNCFFACEIFHN